MPGDAGTRHEEVFARGDEGLPAGLLEGVPNVEPMTERTFPACSDAATASRARRHRSASTAGSSAMPMERPAQLMKDGSPSKRDCTSPMSGACTRLITEESVKTQPVIRPSVSSPNILAMNAAIAA